MYLFLFVVVGCIRRKVYVRHHIFSVPFLPSGTCFRVVG